MSDKKPKKIQSKPWEYTLYRDCLGRFVLKVPYSPKSFVDTHMSLVLTEEEIKMMDADEGWLSRFSEEVRYSPKKYLFRALEPGEFTP